MTQNKPKLVAFEPVIMRNILVSALSITYGQFTGYINMLLGYPSNDEGKVIQFRYFFFQRDGKLISNVNVLKALLKNRPNVGHGRWR